MRIVVNHLARIGQKRFGAAGIDPRTGKHVRPVLEDGPLTVDLLARNGGPFDLAAIVDIGDAVPSPAGPHVEDRVIDPSKVKSRGRADAEAFWKLVRWSTKARLRDIFGDCIKSIGASSCGTDSGKGEASLGCLSPAGAPRLLIESERLGRPRIRMEVSDGEFDLDLSVGDMRVYYDDLVTPNRDAVHKLSAEIRDSDAVILAVGLTREHASSRRYKPVHWLQVTSVHLKEDPARPLG